MKRQQDQAMTKQELAKRILCWCKTFCVRRGWDGLYWIIAPYAYKSIEWCYGEQSHHAW